MPLYTAITEQHFVSDETTARIAIPAARLIGIVSLRVFMSAIIAPQADARPE
jgi:hypothetical protein